MRTNVGRGLLLVFALALSACVTSGKTAVEVRKPYPGKAPDLLQGLKPSLQAEQTLSDEFLAKPAAGTPTTKRP